MSGQPSPTASPFVQVVLDGLKRAHAKPVKKKESFTAEMLNYNAIERDSLVDTRLFWPLLVDEISNIRPCKIQYNADHISIKIPRRVINFVKAMR